MKPPTWKAIVVALMAAGCDATPLSEDAARLGVDFEWTESSGCSQKSPPVRVANLPAETAYLRVTMVDLDMPTYDHGGGEVRYGGSSAIAEGTLGGYYGPCPPPGITHSYEITVQALTTDRKLVIGQGKATRKYPPETENGNVRKRP